jgi:hypothetical protein
MRVEGEDPELVDPGPHLLTVPARATRAGVPGVRPSSVLSKGQATAWPNILLPSRRLAERP